MTPATVSGGMRPFFDFTIDLEVESLNETIMILCARDEDEELTPIG